MPLTVLLSRTLHPLAQWSWETALRSRHEAHLARFGHGHCFILIRSGPCALPLSQRGVAETRHCFALNSSLLPGSFSAGLRRTTRKHSLATPMSDFLVSRGARWNGPSPFSFILFARPTAVHLVCIAVGAAHAPTTSSHLLCSGSLQRGPLYAMTHFPMLCKARWAQMPAERAHTFLATPSRMQNHRSKERRAAQRRLYSRLSTLKRRKSCGRGTPCVNTISEAIPSIMLRETPDDRRVAAPGLHLTHGRVTIVVVWKRFVKKMNL